MADRANIRHSWGGYGGLDDMSMVSSSTTELSRQDSLLSSQRPKQTKTRASTKSPGRSVRAESKVTAQALPMPGRVKVGIRCRPAFQDEIDFAQGEFFSIIDCFPASKSGNNTTMRDEETGAVYDRVALTLLSGKQRDFAFDFAFDARTTQDEVYDRMARPVVEDVLRGINGTIFCYGQTGTGKTYTMGILEFVSNEHAGIIPRAIAQIFNYVRSNSEVDSMISMSFLQIYRETIQDLLGPVGGTSTTIDDNLAVREDPQRGFYVEGLQEYSITNYGEAEALLNMGLENRAMAPTLMNTTSSRSHTILTVNIEQRGVQSTDKVYGTKFSRTIRSKLLMVDLAGSERVRRTVSKGARLSEAKSINTSLSALGNVIAALAERNISHIPYRDSKLTRLLQDSLGGTASTALIATVGPAPVNYGETLSTLMFASRCMAVRTTPILHEEVDYAELCAKLQERLGNIEGEMSEKLLEQQERYETVIRSMQEELSSKPEKETLNSPIVTSLPASIHVDDLKSLLKSLSNAFTKNGRASNYSAWINSMISENNPTMLKEIISNLSGLLAYCHEVLAAIANDSSRLLDENLISDRQYKSLFDNKLKEDLEMEQIREQETLAMEEEDKLLQKIFTSDKVKLGSHLAPLSYYDARSKIKSKYTSNNDPKALKIVKEACKKVVIPSFDTLTSWEDIAQNLTSNHDRIRAVLGVLLYAIHNKDKQYEGLKDELVEQLVERRKREEEVVNWSYILKYLLNSTSKLKKQLQFEKEKQFTDSPAFEKTAKILNQKESNNVRTIPGIPKRVGYSGNEDSSKNENDDGDLDSLDGIKEAFEKTVNSRTNSATQSTKPPSSQQLKSEPATAQSLPIRFPSNPRSNSASETDSKSARSDTFDQTSASRHTSSQSIKSKNNMRYNELPPPPPPSTSPPDTPMASRFPIENRASSFQSTSSSVRGVDNGSRYNVFTKEQTNAPSKQSISLSTPNYEPDVTTPIDMNRQQSGRGMYPPHQSRGVRPISNNQRYVYESRYKDEDGAYESNEDHEIRSTAGSDVAPSNHSFRSAATVQSIPSKVSKAPSLLAQTIARDLGVEGPAADAAMEVIDKVSSITPEQLSQLDPATKAQILQMRKDLGIEERLKMMNFNATDPSRPVSTGRSEKSRSRRSYQENSEYSYDDRSEVSNETDRARIMMEARRYQRNTNTPGTTPSTSANARQSRPSSATRSDRFQSRGR